jgi:hypothetical protein
MQIPKSLNWFDHMFKVREAVITSDNQVPCAMHRNVCADKCNDCVWLKEIKGDGGETVVFCHPPVIWDQH